MLYFINNNQIGLLRIREYQEHKSCPYKYLYSSFHIAYGMRCSAAAVIHMHERTTRKMWQKFLLNFVVYDTTSRESYPQTYGTI